MNVSETLGGIFLVFITALVTWAIAQITTGKDRDTALSKMALDIEKISNKIGTEIQNTSNTAHRALDQIEELRIDTSNRILGVVSLVEKVLENDGRLIHIVEVQHGIIEEQKIK